MTSARLLVLSVYLCHAICAASCSQSQRIADATQDVRRNAESSRGRFVWIGDHATDVSGVQAQAQEGVREQTDIIAATEGIVRALPGIKDATPYWATLLSRALIALSIIGLLALLWMTGAGAFVRQVLASVAGLIPRRQRREADLAVKVMDDGSSEGMREYIAARRASDPVFDAAYSRAMQERYGRTSHANPATITSQDKATPHDHAR
jgi:hypothetical protein